jgi:hypothetical protein
MSKRTIPLSNFTRLIHPMPAFLVTCAGADGRPNAVAIAWLTPVSINPVTAPPLLHLDGNRFTTTSGEVSEPDVGMD